MYKSAELVVAIDSWLANTNARGGVKTVVEVFTRVAISDWNSRLWTLQEGAIPQRLQVMFDNSTIDVNKEYLTDFAQFYNEPAWAMKIELRDTLLKMRGMALSEDVNEAQTVRSVFESVRYRMTTRQSNEAVCLATLFDLNALEVVRIRGCTGTGKNANRMAQIWRMLGRIPCELLWDIAYQPLRIEGLRWAPYSLRGMSKIGIREERSAFAMLYQPEPRRGVVFQCPGILLDCPLQRLHDEFYLKDDQGV